VHFLKFEQQKKESVCSVAVLQIWRHTQLLPCMLSTVVISDGKIVTCVAVTAAGKCQQVGTKFRIF
jgi:hypothetical protein